MNATLFEPFGLGALSLPNRVVMAPMSRARAAADGTPTELMATYYAQRAGAGLIVAESTHVSEEGRIGPSAPGLHTDDHQRGWARIADAVHARGGRIFVQLVHAGRLAHPAFLPADVQPVAPSARAADSQIYTPGGRQPAVHPKELTDTHIKAVIGSFVQAARRAVAAGLDGVEIHAANGFLLHQFLADNANTRTDQWGATPEGRARLTTLVVRAVAEAIGADRVGLRISPRDAYGDVREPLAHHTYPALVQDLTPDRIGYLHLTESGDRELDERIRKLWPTALLVTPRAADPDDTTKERAAGAWLRRGADLVAFGRGFIANPDLVTRLRTGASLNSLVETGLYDGDHHGYTDYPALDDIAEEAREEALLETR